MPSWIYRKQMLSRQDKLRLMWETQQRRAGKLLSPQEPVFEMPNVIVNPGSFAPMPMKLSASNPAPVKKGCGCGKKF